MKRLIRKASNNPVIEGIRKMTDKSMIEKAMYNITKTIASNILSVDKISNEGELYENIVQYLKEDPNYISEHLDIPDELVDALNALDDNQTIELNDYLINDFDAVMGKAIDDII